jgi:MoaA/NifB/PqqE/SkfB family radical SAM enzyme
MSPILDAFNWGKSRLSPIWVLGQYSAAMAELLNRFKLLRGLINGEVASNAPFYVNVDVTERCNLHCIGCIYHSPLAKQPTGKGRDIPVADFQQLCTELKVLGTRVLLLQGEGEPLLHPAICELVAIAKKAGFRTTIITNGTLLNQERVQGLIGSGLDSLRVSLWAATPEEYRENYLSADAHNIERVAAGLKLVARKKEEENARNPKVALHFPINRQNYQSLDRMVELAVATGCNGLSFSPFNEAEGAASSLALSPDQEVEVRTRLRLLKPRLRALSLSHNVDHALLRYAVGPAVWEKFPCYVTWIHARIRVDGAAMPCGRYRLPLGNVFEDGFGAVWSGPGFRAFRRRTLTRSGVASLAGECDCSYCCFMPDNAKVHRIFRWIAPFIARASSL